MSRPVHVGVYYQGWAFLSGPMTQDQADRLPAMAMARLVMDRINELETPMAEDGQPVVRLPSPGSHDPKPEAEPEAKAEVEEKPAAKKATASKART